MTPSPQAPRPAPLFSGPGRAAARAAATASDSVESPTPASVATGRNLSWVRQLFEIGVPVQWLEFIGFDDPGARRRILGNGRAQQGQGLLPAGGCRFDARQADVEPGDSREVPAGIFGNFVSPLPVTALHQEEEVGDPQAWVAAVGGQELSELGVGIVLQRLTGESFGQVQARDFQARYQVQGRACLRRGFGRAIEAQENPACVRSEEHTSELQSLAYLVCRLLLEKKKQIQTHIAG